MANENGTPDLDDLRRELEAVGMVIVPFGDEIHIRRSTLEFIKVRVDDGVLRCRPRIGLLSMSQATWVLLAVEFIEIFAVMHQTRGEAWALGSVFTGLLAFGVHALRYTLADITISRVQAIWLDLRARNRVTGTAPALPRSSAPTRALPEGTLPATQAPGSQRGRSGAEPDAVRSKTPV